MAWPTATTPGTEEPGGVGGSETPTTAYTFRGYTRDNHHEGRSGNAMITTEQSREICRNAVQWSCQHESLLRALEKSIRIHRIITSQCPFPHLASLVIKLGVAFGMFV